MSMSPGSSLAVTKLPSRTISALEAKRERLVAERDRFLNAIGHGGGTVAVLVAKLKEREQQIAEADAQIGDAWRLVQPRLLPKLTSTEAFETGGQSFFNGEYLRGFIERVVESILVYGDGAIVLRFRENGLFAPVVETRFADLERATEPLVGRRKLASDLARDTAEWAGNARRRVLDAGGFPMVQVFGTATDTPTTTDASGGGARPGARSRGIRQAADAGRGPRNTRNHAGKTVSVPRGIRTLVATVKGWSPGPLDDGDSMDRKRRAEALSREGIEPSTDGLKARCSTG